MTDIVERLRSQAMSRMFRSEEFSDGTMVWHPMMLEAADKIIRLREELDATKRAADAFVENERLREENARLREALQPFVEWCANMEAEYPDLDDADCISWNIKMRDIRRAASLVSGYDWTPDE